MGFGKRLGKKLKKNVGKILGGAALGPLGVVLGSKIDSDNKKAENRAESLEGRLEAQPGELAEQELATEEAGLSGLGTAITTRLTDAAKKAGTFAGTSGFQTGLESEQKAQLKGARAEKIGRINALRKRLARPEYDEASAPLSK